eukprot:1026704_1
MLDWSDDCKVNTKVSSETQHLVLTWLFNRRHHRELNTLEDCMCNLFDGSQSLIQRRGDIILIEHASKMNQDRADINKLAHGSEQPNKGTCSSTTNNKNITSTEKETKGITENKEHRYPKDIDLKETA